MGFQYDLAFLGGGNMAEAILKGIVEADLYKPSQILVSDPSADRRDYLEKTIGIKTTEQNSEAVANSEVIVFAVKPQMMQEVTKGIKSATKGDQLYISICAGLKATTIEGMISNDNNPTPRLIRVMPNTPSLIGQGMAGVSKGSHSSDEDRSVAVRIFDAVGKTVVISEDQMDGLTAVTGSGPAYVFYMIESLIDAAVERGFSEEDARKMVLQMVKGAANLAETSEKTPAELRRAVTSPNGVTAEGIEALRENGFAQAISRCVQASENRSRELSKA